MSCYFGLPLRLWFHYAETSDQLALRHSSQLLLKYGRFLPEDCSHELVAGLCSPVDGVRKRALAYVPEGREAEPYLAALQIARDTKDQQLLQLVNEKLRPFSPEEINAAKLPRPRYEGRLLRYWLDQAEKSVRRFSFDAKKETRMLSLVGREAEGELDAVLQSAQRIEYQQRPITYYWALAGIGQLTGEVLNCFVEGLSHPMLNDEVAESMKLLGPDAQMLGAKALAMLYEEGTYAEGVIDVEQLQMWEMVRRWRSNALQAWASFGEHSHPALPILERVFNDPEELIQNRIDAAQALFYFEEYQERAQEFLVACLIEGKSPESSAAEALQALGPRVKHLIPRLSDHLSREYFGYHVGETIAVILNYQPVDDPVLRSKFLEANKKMYFRRLDVIVCLLFPEVAAEVEQELEKLLEGDRRIISPNVYDAIAAAGPQLKGLVPRLLEMLRQEQEGHVDAAGGASNQTPTPVETSTSSLYGVEFGFEPERANCIDLIKALGDIGSAAHEALKVIKPLTSHPRWDVRFAAREAISKIDPS